MVPFSVPAGLRQLQVRSNILAVYREGHKRLLLCEEAIVEAGHRFGLLTVLGARVPSWRGQIIDVALIDMAELLVSRADDTNYLIPVDMLQCVPSLQSSLLVRMWWYP